jgi:NAD(P)-dependent dehydrogenase (short-subunit alcohol dehydrogenase family)
MCIVTGATQGIGEATALALAKAGGHVVMIGRDAARVEAAKSRVGSAVPGAALTGEVADLASQKDIRALAARLLANYSSMPVLINNAGGIFAKRVESVDGIEYTFALNHLGYFLLTELLIERIKASAPARIVNVGSQAQRMGRLNFDDLQRKRSYRGMGAYSQSKLANATFTYALARRLEGTAVTVNCVHPGGVATGFGRNNSGPFAWGVKVAARFLRTPAEGADTVAWLAMAPELEDKSGGYYADRKPIRSRAESYDVAVQERLWSVSEQMTAASAQAMPQG